MAAIVKTPKVISITSEDQKNVKSIEKFLSNEFRTHQRWTPACTAVLEENTSCLFSYDRLDYGLKKAFGASWHIALNPLMILCHHPVCREKNAHPRKLRHMFNLTEYLDHLENHCDEIGLTMQLRFKEINENPFATSEELDEIAPSPFSICGQDDETNSTQYVEQYGIQRLLFRHPDDASPDETFLAPDNPTYICHWKDTLISNGIIKSSSLSFQEDDALIQSVLRYPDPISDWSSYGTLSLYALKLKCAVSDTALSLHRGITYNRINTKKESLPDIATFAQSINHPCTSITRTQSSLPALKFENKTYHPSEVLFHITCLERNKESFRFDLSELVTRFPVTAGIDEQENNQGTFIHKGELCGLEKKMTAEDIRKIGIDNIGSHIAKENPFVIAARECRLTDFSSIFCSNVLTTFETHALKADECARQLNEMVSFAMSCKTCLINHVKCQYEKLNEPCQTCLNNGSKCISLVVFHVNWDMGGSHKKVEKEDQSFVLDLSSDESMLMNSKAYTIGFGGLHIAKALVNSLRNHVMIYDGQHFGIDMLISLRKVSERLQLLKNAVFVGKDRQSDLLAYLTVSPMVQEALKMLQGYCLQRVPEQYLSFKKNASSQKKILYPVDVCANRNGETFVLDAGNSCIHVVDRSTVAAVYMIGKYGSSSLKRYSKSSSNAVSNIRLSTSLKDMSVDSSDNIYVSDSERKEVIIIRCCSRAKKCPKTKFHVLKLKRVVSSSVSTHDDKLYTLRLKKSGMVVQLVSFKLAKKPNNKVFLKHEILLKAKLSVEVDKLFAVPFDSAFGGCSKNGDMMLFSYVPNRKRKLFVAPTELKSVCKPAVNNEGVLVLSTDNRIKALQLNFDGKSVSTKDISFKYPDYHGAAAALCIRGKVTSLMVKKDGNYCLMQMGTLDFAISYAEAVSDLYDAVGYIPPRGDRDQRMRRRQITFEEALKKGDNCMKFFNCLQEEAVKRNPDRSSFQGADGMPFTGTIQALRSTVQSWQIIKKRCDLLREGSSSLIHPPAVTSEKNVEHGFGFATKKSQGNNSSMEEYIIAKRRSTMDFQLRMSQMPFCQETKDSVQDKGYQQLEGSRCKISVKDLKEIFQFAQRERFHEEQQQPSKHIVEPSDEDKIILKKAYLLSKSVPRQTNRTKWREKSGYQANMLLAKECPGMIYAGDLVCCRTVSDKLIFLIVMEDVLLQDVDVKVSVRFPEGTIPFEIGSDKLEVANGQIMVLPPQLFEVVDGEVVLSDAVSVDFQSLSEKQGVDVLSEEDRALLVDTSCLPEDETTENIGAGKRKASVGRNSRNKR